MCKNIRTGEGKKPIAARRMNYAFLKSITWVVWQYSQTQQLAHVLTNNNLVVKDVEERPWKKKVFSSFIVWVGGGNTPL